LIAVTNFSIQRSKGMRYLFFLLFIVPFSIGFTQNLAESELRLKSRLDELRSAKSDNEIKRINSLFTKEMGAFLRLEGAYQFQFTQLTSIADLKSEDGLVRIVHWNLEFKDFSYSYSGFIMHWDDEQETCKVFDLVDVTDPYTMISEQVIDSKNWYGALYYRIIPVEIDNDFQYILFGWDGATTNSNFKLIDVLSFKGNAAKFGSPLFINKNKTLKRVVFEFADKSTMSLKMDEKRNRIVFDHLSPESPALTGLYSYYIPDFSYDAYVWEDDRFVLNEDVIATNDMNSTNETTLLVMDPKTGKVKKEVYKLKWINPMDDNRKGDIGHVARTPESEDFHAADESPEQVEPPKKKWWDRRNPNNLSVTTGKYRKNRRRPPEP
jgi:hypothetical protein